MIVIRAFLLICLLAVVTAGQQAAQLPKCFLPTVKGQTLRSRELKDNIVVLDFWDTWCETCISEIPAFNKTGKGIQLARGKGHWSFRTVRMGE